MAGDSIFAEQPRWIEPGGAIVHDYYILRKQGEALGVIAKKDMNKKVAVYKDDVTDSLVDNLVRIGKSYYDGEPISKAEYDTYIAFGIPDFGTKTSWKKWMKSWRK